MIDNIVKKGLVLAVIVLFIGVSFQPVLAVDIKTVNETIIQSRLGNDEKVEYVIQIIKTNKVIENKVYLTKQQADELDNLIENIRADLNNSGSIEETSEIFGDAINSFNNLGLFSEDIGKDEIRQLVSGQTQKINSIKFKNHVSSEFVNKLCFVAGKTTQTDFFGPSFLFYLLSDFSIFDLLVYIFYIFYQSFGYKYCYLPFSIGGTISIGINDWYQYIPGEGWIYTIGINGNNNLTGSFYGQISELGAPYAPMIWLYIGIVGFTGIQIYKDRHSAPNFYLGYALKVNIGTEHPYN